eukprot:Sspe_Gene.1805::Locus_602_Transcript_1_1_Confidence_1.000_Length_1829::g.1805::m.1805
MYESERMAWISGSAMARFARISSSPPPADEPSWIFITVRSNPVLALGVVRLKLQPLFVLNHRLVVLLAEEVDVRLPHDGLHKGGADLQALLTVLLRLVVRPHLHVRSSPVAVQGVVRGVALDRLVVLVDGLLELLVPEELVPTVLGLFRELRVEVRLFLCLLLRRLALVELVKGVTVAVLQQRLLVPLDSLVPVLLPLEAGTLARHGLCDILEVPTRLPPFLDGLVTLCEALLVVPLLKVHSSLVVHVLDVVRLRFQCLVVHGQRLSELLLLVVFVTLRLKTSASSWIFFFSSSSGVSSRSGSFFLGGVFGRFGASSSSSCPGALITAESSSIMRGSPRYMLIESGFWMQVLTMSMNSLSFARWASLGLERMMG